MNAARKGKRNPISPSQIKVLHALAGAMGWDDDTYRDNLEAQPPFCRSSTDLSWREAEAIREDWERKAVQMGVWKVRNTVTPPVLPLDTGRGPKGGGVKKYSDLDGRPGFANGAQLRLIDAMFAQVTRAEGEEAIEKALNSFVSRIVHVAGLRMVKGWQVEKIVKALEGMGAVKKAA